MAKGYDLVELPGEWVDGGARHVQREGVGYISPVVSRWEGTRKNWIAMPWDTGNLSRAFWDFEDAVDWLERRAERLIRAARKAER